MTRPALLTLEDAAELLPAEMTVGTLRGLIRRGVLPKRKLGKRLWLTPDDLMRLTECPASASPRGSTSAPTPANSSSETATLPGGQAAALASVNRLRQRSRDTSKAAPPRGEVVPLTRTS
jgi:hypothetical protein